MTTIMARAMAADFITRQYGLLEKVDPAVQREVGDFIRRLNDLMVADIEVLEAGEKPVLQDWMTASMWGWRLLEVNATRCEQARKWKDTLVLIKAQHPLLPDGRPGPEYEARLERAFRAYGDSTLLCVGGVHEGSDVSLASAGEQWLQWRRECTSVSKVDVIVEPEIYSGNDEDWRALDIMRERGFKDLVIVCSDGQYMRSYMACLIKGVIPRYEQVTFGSPWQQTVLELTGPWSIQGFIKDGPVAAFINAAATVERHKREATEA